MSIQTEAQKALLLLNRESNKARTSVKEEFLSKKVGLKKYDDALKHYFSMWDDSIRQGLVSIAFQAVGSEPKAAVPLQIALTFIDATMDIHDDIIDESLKKKRAKTLYGRLGKTAALLLGDLMLVRGFNLLHSAIEDLSTEKQSAIMEITNNFLSEVVRAHVAEAELKPKKLRVNPYRYLDILQQKASEIEGRLMIAGICGGGTEKENAALGKFGRALGTLLAVRAEFTDLFDFVELSNRLKSECLPLQILFAIQKRTKREEIYSLLVKPNFEMKDMQNLLQILMQTNCLSKLNKELVEIQNQAISQLNHLRDSEAKNSLKLIVTSILEDM
jgi:heptaprenyl diphosphate synthase